MDNSLLPQHKRLAMGMAVNNEPAGASKNMVNDMVTRHKPYGIHKNLSGKNDSPSKSGLSSFSAKK